MPKSALNSFIYNRCRLPQKTDLIRQLKIQNYSAKIETLLNTKINEFSTTKLVKHLQTLIFFRIRINYQSETKHGSEYDKTRYEYKNIKKMNVNQNILLVRKNLIRVRKTINKFNLKWKILQRRSSLSKFLPHREIKKLRQFFFFPREGSKPPLLFNLKKYFPIQFTLLKNVY